MAMAARPSPPGQAHGGNAQLAVPQLFQDMFPSWFAGFAFAAIAIGALVPAAIMSIAAANLFTRNIYKEFIRPDATPARGDQGRQAGLAAGEVRRAGFVLALEKTFAINFQLLGGVWILQTFPAIVVGLYTRWFHRWALLLGWAAAMVYGTVQAYRVPVPGTPGPRILAAPPPRSRSSARPGYIALTAFVINLIVAVVLTLIFRATRLPAGTRRDPGTALHRRRRRPSRPGSCRRPRRRGRGPERDTSLRPSVNSLVTSPRGR